MSDEDDVAAIVEQVWLSLRDDWTGLWEIISDVRGQIPEADADEVRRLTELVVRELVRRRVRIGEIFGRPGFTAWEGDDVVERLFAAWDELGHEPDMYEVAWFELPAPLGDEQEPV